MKGHKNAPSASVRGADRALYIVMMKSIDSVSVCASHLTNLRVQR